MPAPIAPTVIDALQQCVSLHLTAVEHYATVAEHLARWGYKKLAERFAADADEERLHLSAVLGRLEFFDVQPTFVHAAPAWPRLDVPGILDASLTLESGTASAERQAVTAARAAGDEVTAVLLAGNLAGSEEGIQRIEADRLLISQIGLDNWLANQA